MGEKTILTITASFRNKEEITEVKELEQLRKKTQFSQADIYLMGLRDMENKLKRAKSIVR